MFWILPSRRPALLLCGIALVTTGCTQIGQQVGEGLKQKIREAHLDSIAGAAADSAILAVAQGPAAEALEQRLDTLLANATERLDTATVRLRDRLIGVYTEAWIEAVSADLRATVKGASADARDELVGPMTAQRLLELRRRLLDQETLDYLGEARDELVGEALQARVDSIVLSAVRQAGSGYEAALEPALRRTLADVRTTTGDAAQDFKGVAIAVGAIAAGLLVLFFHFWRVSRRHRSALRTVTGEIDGIGDRQTYDELVGRIRRRAVAAGVEGHLRRVLEEDGLHQQPAWQEQDGRIVRLMGAHLSELQERGDLGALRQRARREGLEPHLEAALEGTADAERR